MYIINPSIVVINLSFSTESNSTCLKSRFHDVRRDAHDPVEDSGQPAGQDGLADAEVRPGAALRDQRALDDLVAPEVCGTGGNV